MSLTVRVVSVDPPRKPSFLASVKIELFDENGASLLIIDDLRILKNKEGQLWVGPPNFSVPEGKGWRYVPSVIFSRELRRAVEDAVLTAFEAQQQDAGVQS